MNTNLLNKLNYKDEDILLINPPAGFPKNLEGLEYDTEPGKLYGYIQIFVYKKDDIPNAFKLGVENLKEGGKLWFCYAKKSSELYTDISRDEGWEIADKYEFVAVRQIAIDDDWSALRFKPIKDVKNLTRKRK